MYRLEAVRKRNVSAALRHLQGGAAGDFLPVGQLRALETSLGEREDRLLWWARRGRDVRAVAAVVISAGRVGMLRFSPPEAPGVDTEALAELLRRVVREGFASGAAMMQSMIDPSEEPGAAVLAEAGLEKLATLVRMRRDVRPLPEPRQKRAWVYLRGEQIEAKSLQALIAATYENTRDCPGLCGRRRMEDVLASHRATGRYTPQWWQVANWEDRPVGCALVNRRAGGQAELVYLGVRPEARGEGLGWDLVCRGLSQIHQAGVDEMHLMVDRDNAPAMKLYESMSFERGRQRDVWAAFEGPVWKDCE
jgi:ribosomal protein S18 acetylase RimI-like enzyme